MKCNRCRAALCGGAAGDCVRDPSGRPGYVHRGSCRDAKPAPRIVQPPKRKRRPAAKKAAKPRRTEPLEPRACLWHKCGIIFTPKRRGTKYCSGVCRNAATQYRYRTSKPDIHRVRAKQYRDARRPERRCEVCHEVITRPRHVKRCGKDVCERAAEAARRRQQRRCTVTVDTAA